MENVEFNEPEYRVRPAAKPSRLSQLVLRTGLAKDEAGAQRILLITAGVAVLAAMGIFMVGSSGNVEPPPREVFDVMR